ncbi:MAG TPA: S-adenosylmethionine:tRNA ribosyltransferase-isomerase [Kofleriaceae bacterium]|nr:S-adenosylmethionine:tRNA ribosyltransferase-isomerase [Kofleriaceae bacterium]
MTAVRRHAGPGSRPPGEPWGGDAPQRAPRGGGFVDPERGEARGDRAASPLGAGEVSRHDVRLVIVAAGAAGAAGAPEAASAAGSAPRVEPFAALPRLLRRGDLVVVNDAATLPASLPGRTAGGEVFELRLSGPVEGSRLLSVLLGPGDHRTRTEHRPPPPRIEPGERVTVGGMVAAVASAVGRRVELVVRAEPDALWQALYAGGAPVQYAHRSERLALWSVQTAYAGRPWAAEMPSAGRPLTWDIVLGLCRAGIEIAALTHAAGLSSTGDDALDRALPWPERYEIPRRTADAIARARARGGRVIAVGTSVVRALEAAAADAAVGPGAAAGEIRPGSGIAALRLDASYRPRVVAGLVSGLHVPGESHFELLSALAPVDRLIDALALAARHGMSSHELGDACLILPAPA